MVTGLICRLGAIAWCKAPHQPTHHPLLNGQAAIMKLHADTIIAPAKLTHYLLIFRPIDYATRQAKFISLYPNKEDDCGF